MRSFCRIFAFLLLMSNANAPACKKVAKALVCSIKNRIVITEFISAEKFSII